jgi:hypothetical protein
MKYTSVYLKIKYRPYYFIYLFSCKLLIIILKLLLNEI